jgi:uncharacterized protein YcfJ
MKYGIPLIAVTLATGCGAALASEFGKVISSTAVTAPFAVPQQECRDDLQPVPPRTSGGGAPIGALIGGPIGNTVGSGPGRAAATGLGVLAGAALGDHAEAADGPPALTTVRNCQVVTRYEDRVIGYDVVYEYNGQRHATHLAKDPGARIALDVTVAPAGGTVAVAAPSSMPPPLPAAPSVVYSAEPVYAPAPAYLPAPVVGYYGSSAYDYYGTCGPYGFCVYGGPAVAVAPRVVIGSYRHHGY